MGNAQPRVREGRDSTPGSESANIRSLQVHHHLVVLGLFPIVLIWPLFPRAQFQPLATYFAVLFFTTSTPLWWALVDIAARLAGGVSPNLWTSPGEWAAGLSASLVVTVLGILLVPVVLGMLIVGSWRAIGGLWRGVP